MRKKSQITLFVMLGLVLLIIFIILLFIKESFEKKTYGLDQILNELEAGRIKNHVTNCITDVSMDGLEMLGANGGLIYDFQGGRIPFRALSLGGDYLNYTSQGKHYFVAYALKKNELCNQLSYLTPEYPILNSRFSELNQIYNTNCLYDSPYSAYDGFFGQSVMTKLCYILRESGCEPFAKGTLIGFTIQKQLENYTATKLPLCVNFSAFADRMGLVNITAESSPIVEVNVHAADLVLTVKYTVKIIFEDREPVTRLVDYQTTLNVRFGAVYNFIYNLLSMDSKNIALNINNEYISSSYWKQGFELKKINNPCESCSWPYREDDILEVADKKSFVEGKPLVFRVAIENRRPALDFIEDMVIDGETATEFSVPLTAYDPDDKKVKYYFLSFGKGRPECTGIGMPPALLEAITGMAGSGLEAITGFGVADCKPWNDGPTCERVLTEQGLTQPGKTGWSVFGVGVANNDHCDDDGVDQGRTLQGGPYYLVCNGGGKGYLLKEKVGGWSGVNDAICRNSLSLSNILREVDCNGLPVEVSEFELAQAEFIGATDSDTPANTRIRLCDANASRPPSSLMCGAKGWCEADPRIKLSLPYAEIWAPITESDAGKHEVAVLALDDSGMFDYQTFWINITFSQDFPPANGCVDACTGDGGAASHCTNWCIIAANPCRSDCSGGNYPGDDNCQTCVDLILNSAKRYHHLNCSDIIEKKECIDNMPDCFWVRENESNAFAESCYNDYNLNLVNPPAYIIDFFDS